MILREQIEALPSTGTTDEWDLDGIHRNSENVERQAVLDIIDQHECEDRDDIRDACEAAGLPSDGALWLLLNTVRARALSDPSLRCSYGHSIDKVGKHECIPDRDALARALANAAHDEGHHFWCRFNADCGLYGDSQPFADAIIDALKIQGSVYGDPARWGERFGGYLKRNIPIKNH